MRFAGESVTFPCGHELDAAVEKLTAGPAVFAIHLNEGRPYIARTALLRRRLKRLLRDTGGASRLLNLRLLASHVEYWPTASRLQSTLLLYDLARNYMPDDYLDLLKLRTPPFVRLLLANRFPRTQVITRLTAGAGESYGPFRSRAAAEQFEHQLLDLFQIRRCQEDLQPCAGHPGCIYGEMGMCLRPCQEVVTPSEYASEVARVSNFLRTGGKLALASAESARDRLSADLDFEAAAREHKRVEKIQELLRLRDDLVREVNQSCGIAVLPSVNAGETVLWPMAYGAWQRAVSFSVAVEQSASMSASMSMDRRLRELASSIVPEQPDIREQQEHLAILARWYYSSWRDGIWIEAESLDRLPWRRLVSAISRTVHQSSPAASH